MDGNFEVHQCCLVNSDILWDFFEGTIQNNQSMIPLCNIIYVCMIEAKVVSWGDCYCTFLNKGKLKPILKMRATKNSTWNCFENRQFEKSMILSMEYLMKLFPFQMLSKSWLTAWLMEKLSKNLYLKWIFTMNWLSSWERWRLGFLEIMEIGISLETLLESTKANIGIDLALP